ncbi:MAG: MFS transporter [Betaproteobacteria bacterium]|nr:MAG: MFS transporter [Betaproteobacteria bacterium]
MNDNGPAAGAGDAPAMSRAYLGLIGCLTAASMLGTAAVTVLPTLAPAVAASYGVPPIWIGYQFSLVAFAMPLALLLLGDASRRWGPVRVIQGGITLIAAALVLVLVPSLPALVIASVGLGVGYGVIMPANSHLMMRFTPRAKLNLVFSVQQTGIPLGAILAATGAPVIAVATTWQAPVALLAALVLLLAIALAAQRGRWDDDRDPAAALFRDPFAGLGIVFRSARLRRLSVSGFCFSGAQFCLGTYTVVALVEQLGYGLVMAGIILSIAQLAGVACRLYCGWIADRTGDSIGVLIWLTAGMALAGATSLGLHDGWPVLLVCLLFAIHGAATIGWPGTYLAEVGRLSPPGQVSVCTSGTLLFTNTGKMLAPLAFAAVQARTGSYSLAFGLIGVLGVIGLCALLLARSSDIGMARASHAREQ